MAHRCSDCPLKKTTNVAEKIEEREEEEPKSSTEYEENPMVVIGNEGEYVNYVVRRILLLIKREDQSQREQIFRTRCII